MDDDVEIKRILSDSFELERDGFEEVEVQSPGDHDEIPQTNRTQM
jgi:hypothetical protein